MALNRIEFQRGLWRPDFRESYGTEAACEAALFTSRWPQGFVCPRCHGTRYAPTFNGRKLWACLSTDCRYLAQLRGATFAFGRAIS